MLIEHNQEGFAELPIRTIAKKAYKVFEKENHPIVKHVWGNNTTIIPFKYLSNLENEESVHHKFWYPISFSPHLPIVGKPFVYYNISLNVDNSEEKDLYNLDFELVFNLQNKEGREVRLLSVKRFTNKFESLEDSKIKRLYHFEKSENCKRLIRHVASIAYGDTSDGIVQKLVETIKMFYTDIYNMLIVSLQESAREFIKTK